MGLNIYDCVMSEYVAVASESSLSGIKQQLLLFDRIAVIKSELDWDRRKDEPSLAADLDWLENQGLLFRIDEFLNRECGFEFEDRKDAGKGIVVKLTDIPKHKIKEVTEARLGKNFVLQFSNKTIRDFMEGLDDLACRWEAQRLTNSGGMRALSISAPRMEIDKLLGVHATKGDVIRVALNGMPQPSDETSLEHIIQFRSDTESKKKMYALRRWIQTMAARQQHEHEASEELEWLVRQYEEHMRLHKLKVNRGIVEVFVTTTAEVAEDLIKFRWGKLAKLPFALSHKKIDLLEAEMKTPGREMAYVANARKRFSSV